MPGCTTESRFSGFPGFSGGYPVNRGWVFRFAPPFIRGANGQPETENQEGREGWGAITRGF